MRVLYISYDGLMEPLAQSQVLPYLQELSRLGHSFTLVTYEKSGDWHDHTTRKAMERAVSEDKIRWVPLCYHKWPITPATAYDVAVGLLLCTYLVLRYRIQIVHVRGYQMAVIGLCLKRIFRTRFVFDPRTLWPDQYLEHGRWRESSPMFRIAKWSERRFLLGADVIVSLTHSAVRAMREFPYLQHRTTRFEVITTCTNLQLFRPPEGGDVQNARCRAGRFTLGHVGSVGFYNFDAEVECFKLLGIIRPGAHFSIINRNEHMRIRDRLNAFLIPEDYVTVRAVEHAKVVEEMWKMDAGILFLNSALCRLHITPTKLGEFLACGIPCLINAGVGDVEELFENEGVLVILRAFTPEAMGDAVHQLVTLAESEEVRDRCISVARRYFSLDDGVQSYHRIHRYLAEAD